MMLLMDKLTLGILAWMSSYRINLSTGGVDFFEFAQIETCSKGLNKPDLPLGQGGERI